MKFFSNIELAKIFLSLLLFVWIIGLCLIVVNHALSCVTADGCLKSQCSYEWLKTEYQQIIDKNSYKCRNRVVTLTTTNNTINTINSTNTTNVTNTTKSYKKF